jgi:hypothetical protein
MLLDLIILIIAVGLYFNMHIFVCKLVEMYECTQVLGWRLPVFLHKKRNVVEILLSCRTAFLLVLNSVPPNGLVPEGCQYDI